MNPLTRQYSIINKKEKNVENFKVDSIERFSATLDMLQLKKIKNSTTEFFIVDKGSFAPGDIVCYDDKMKLILVRS